MSIINVDCENLENHPHCAHGPTLKFSRLVKGKIKSFFACSACRDRKDCPFFMWEDEKLTNSKLLALNAWKQDNFPQIQPTFIYQRLMKFKNIKTGKYFCLTCFDFVFPDEKIKHKTHSLKLINSNNDFSTPTKIIEPLTKNKNQAQYWFSSKSCQFIVNNMTEMDYKKIVCIGTPTLHEIFKVKNFCSLLLDIDHRYHWFYEKDEFIWFNMFNFYFLGDENSCLSTLQRFLDNSVSVVIIDPPFGARIEPLQNTIKQIQSLSPNKLQILLILPYFMEPQVMKSFPDFTMLDFPVEYTNHKKFINKRKSCDSKTSPVRIFTNICPQKFVFPENEGYHYCEKCEAWRSKLNTHCDMCGICPSKNGASYKHCFPCKKCVKQTWNHCKSCQICLPDHTCKSPHNIGKYKKRKKK